MLTPTINTTAPVAPVSSRLVDGARPCSGNAIRPFGNAAVAVKANAEHGTQGMWHLTTTKYFGTASHSQLEVAT